MASDRRDMSMGERCDELLMDAIAPEFGASVLRPREQAGGPAADVPG